MRGSITSKAVSILIDINEFWICDSSPFGWECVFWSVYRSVKICICSQTHNIGIQIKRKKLTKTFITILN